MLKQINLALKAQSFFRILLAFIAISIFTTSCKDNTVDVPDTQIPPPKVVVPPSISSITSTCFLGSTVVISGDNFSTTIEDNNVKFGTIKATVTAATKTSLTVTTPDLGSATSANVTVTTSDKVSNSKSIAVDADQNKIVTYAWTSHTVKPGLTYKTGELTLFGTDLRRIFILDVTLNESNTLGIGFTTTDVNTVTMCNNYSATVGVNAGYFPYMGSSNKDPYIRINSVAVQNGQTGVSPLFTNSALLINNNVATVRKFSESGNNLNPVAAAIPIAQAQNIIVCGPMLITSGVLETLNMSEGHNNSLTGRTGLGVNSDGKRVFMVVADTGGSVKGITTPQLAKILQALGSVNAMNLDGGGSSTMFVKNQGDNGRVNFPTGGTWMRPVRSVIYVK
jgi:exopolysaccharide biosynthesis protein